jgi:hypothetical protein
MTTEGFGAFDQIAWSLTVIALCHVVGMVLVLLRRWR